MDQEYTWDQCQYFGFYVDKATRRTMFVPVVSFKDGMPIFDAGTPIQGSLTELVETVPGLLGLYKLDDVGDSQSSDDILNVSDKLHATNPMTIRPIGGFSDLPTIGKIDWGKK